MGRQIGWLACWLAGSEAEGRQLCRQTVWQVVMVEANRGVYQCEVFRSILHEFWKYGVEGKHNIDKKQEKEREEKIGSKNLKGYK